MWFWILVGLVAAPVIWFVLKVAVGLAVSPRVSGSKLLQQKMGQLGVSPVNYPPECIHELVDGAIRVAEMRKMMGNAKFNTAFVEQLEAIALIAREYEKGQLGEFDLDNPITKILASYRRIRQKGEKDG